jgi:hypothetical protein
VNARKEAAFACEETYYSKFSADCESAEIQKGKCPNMSVLKNLVILIASRHIPRISRNLLRFIILVN